MKREFRTIALIAISLSFLFAAAACSSTAAPTSSESADGSEVATEADGASEAAVEQGALKRAFDCWFGLNGTTFDIEGARSSFQLAADDGNAEALYWLGAVRTHDQDIDRWADAAAYYQAAVDAGSPYGLYGLGTLYETGNGTNQDRAMAIDYYTRAAEAGCLMGDVALGRMYSRGIGVNVDAARAQELFAAALESSNFETRNMAKVCLGDMYRFGYGVPQDDVQAFAWYLDAANEGYYLGCQKLGDSYALGAGVEQDFAQMLDWYSREAEKGSAYSLGMAYLYGMGTEPDPGRAFDVFQQTVRKGDRSAALCMCGLATMYANGLGVEADEDEAAKWSTKAMSACGTFDDYNASTAMDRNPRETARGILQQLGRA